MPKLGDTFRCSLPPRHIWVIITDPNVNNHFLLVNITSLTDNCVDDVCILDPPDYPPFLTHRSTVAYSGHKIGNSAGIDLLLKSGEFLQMPAIPPATLKKIIDKAHLTTELPEAAKILLPAAPPDAPPAAPLLH
jgi:hypothetical protein